MFSLLCVTLLSASSWALPITETYYTNYSPSVGLGTGTGYVTNGEGHITGIKVWEVSNNYISGFQLRYSDTWGDLVGKKVDTEQRLDLYDGETIVQLSGKFHSGNYIYQVSFVTSKGRYLMCGQPYGTSFNFYAQYPGTELLFLSGRNDSTAITSIGAHWGVVNHGIIVKNNTSMVALG